MMNNLNGVIGSPRLQTLTATAAMVVPDNSNCTNLMGAAGAALTFTLPEATGSGDVYRFAVSVVNTSNYLIKVDSASAVMDGQITTASTGDTPDLAQPWVTASTSDTITLNGTTTGGVAIGDWVELHDIAANQWAVTGETTTSGTEATPFSATVS